MSSTVGEIFEKTQQEHLRFSAPLCKEALWENIKESQDEIALKHIFGIQEGTPRFNNIQNFMFGHELRIRLTKDFQEMFGEKSLQGKHYEYVLGQTHLEESLVTVHNVKDLESLRKIKKKRNKVFSQRRSIR